MKPLIPLVLVLLSGGALEGLRHSYEAESSLRVTTELTVVTETVDSEMIIDGEVREPRGGNGPSEESYELAWVDRIVETAEGAPTRLVRTFEELAGESSRTFGEEEMFEDRESPFDGLVIELGLDEEGELELEVLEGSEPDEELLEGHALASPVDGLLEGAELEEGATWDLDDAAIRRALTLDLEPLLFPRAEPAEAPEPGGRGGRGGGGRGGAQGMPQRDAEWEGEATLAELEGEYDDMEVAVIELTLESSGDLPEPQGGGGGGRGGRGGGDALAAPATARRDNTYEYELAGRLYFDLEHQRPVALELEGTLTRRIERVSSRGGREVEVRSTRVGEWTQVTKFEIVEDDQ